MSTIYTPTPVTVTFQRPKCFCGYTAVSIYPDPVTTKPSTSISDKDRPLTSNWVYECHFTPKQRGMTKPDTCNDCEEARNRSIRKYTELMVELWPRPTSSEHSSKTSNNKDNDNETLVGANIGIPSTFHGLSPLDHLRVCGFHMHALEWHHMQTVGIDQILRLVEKTRCPVFNLSVVRWLGEQIRKPTKSNLAKTTTRSSMAGTYSKSKDKDATSMIMGMELKFFHKMGCLCKKEVALARTPAPPTNASSSTATISRRSGAMSSVSATPENERQFWIVCRARAEAKSSFEIADCGGTGLWEKRAMLGSYGATTSGSGSGSSRRWRNVIPAGASMSVPAQMCSFAIPLEIANFGYNRIPIHTKVETNTWLSNWLSPPSALSLSLPRSFFTSTTSKQMIPAAKGAASTGWKLQPGVVSSKQGQLMTMRYLEQEGWPWSTPFLYKGDDQSQERETSDYSRDDYTHQQFLRWREGLRRAKQSPEKCDLESLDKELQDALAQHVIVLRSRMSADEEGYLREMDDDNLDSQFYKKLDMDAIPTVSLQLCKDCRQDTDADAAIQAEVEAEVDLELERVDRELEEVMTRHAEQVQRIMEARS
ncbi:hypothetical protein BGZ97_007316, partial [Linnemannia gamsii]